MIKVAVLGYGTVGSGIVEVIMKNKKRIEERIKDEICVGRILDLRKFPGDPYESIITDKYDDIINDPTINVVCEAMGGTKPAYDFTKRALQAGKSVCTSNKAVVAEFGPELMKIAQENRCHYLFEASVGGGIPIIRPLNESLTPEMVDGITGILNGTTNYILTKMEREGSDFELVLKEAQEKGYAEKNPEADVEGYDAARKIAILSSIAYGKTVDYREVMTEGITKITTEDFAYAKTLGSTIKLFGLSKKENDEVFAMVAPFMVFPGHPLYAVNDVFNGILVHGNTLGDTMYYGSGAGKLPTASAVVSDIIEIVRNLGREIPCDWKDEHQTLTSPDKCKRNFFVRTSADQEQIQKAFGKVAFVEAGIEGECGFMTEIMTEAQAKAAASQVNAISFIRMEM